MTDKAEKSIQKSSSILYIGSDEAFFENIQDEIKKTVPLLDVDYERVFSNDDKVIQSYILKLREDRPKVVLVDFTNSDRALLHLVRVWMRQNFYTKISFIGLVDQNQHDDTTPKAIMAAIPCIHIKSAELEAIVYDIMILGFPDKVEDHGFATAQMEDPVNAYYPCKASIISPDSIQVESNVPLRAKQTVNLHTYWSKKHIINSSLCILGSQGQENLYYNFEYSQKLLFVHAKPIVKSSDMSPEEVKLREEDRAQLLNESQHKIQKWIKTNGIDSSPKFLKAYIIDKSGAFFNERDLTDRYPFVLRNQPFIQDAYSELKKVMPQLIMFNLEKVEAEELEANSDIAHTYNETRMLQLLVKQVKSLFPKDPPILIVFNSPDYDTAYLQKTLNYPSVLAFKDQLDPDLALKLANKLKDKLEKNVPKPKQGEVYINKVSELSYAEIETDIIFRGCSENDVYFDADEDIPLYTSLKISHPVAMYITVVEAPKFSRIQSKYYALVHGISQDDKKNLRKYINTVFFRELDLEKAQDQKDMEKIKKDFIAKKKQEQEEAKRLAEEEKKAEAEPEADSKENEEKKL